MNSENAEVKKFPKLYTAAHSHTYINITTENIATEHLCCAIADKKHQCGVNDKRAWLSERLKEGHVFRKLDQKGKVFIEYAPLEKAWTPVEGTNYLYIYCLWVSGSFKGKGIRQGTARLLHGRCKATWQIGCLRHQHTKENALSLRQKIYGALWFFCG